MDNTQRLIKKAKEMGINTDEIVYSVCIGDVIDAIAETLVDDLEIDIEYVEEHLEELVETGIRGCENIDWSTPIENWLLYKVRPKVFVYGTLRKGCGNNFVIAEADGYCIGKGKIQGYEMYTNGAYPMVIRGSGTVVGEVYEVSDLVPLDELEGYPNLYIRETAVVKLENGEKMKALVYTQSHRADHVRKNRVKIPEGDWVEWVRKYRKESGICA